MKENSNLILCILFFALALVNFRTNDNVIAVIDVLLGIGNLVFYLFERKGVKNEKS